MPSTKLEQKNLMLKLEVSELNAHQIRLVKTVTTMLTHVMATDDESEYFEGTKELMKLVSRAVKEANFASDLVESNIPYAEQALEFGLDYVTDYIYNNKLTLDN